MLKIIAFTGLAWSIFLSDRTQITAGETPVLMASVTANDSSDQPRPLSALEYAADRTTEERVSDIVDFEGFITLSQEVYAYRKDRLINLDSFMEKSQQPNTIILDTRSDSLFAYKHIKGAVHLNFSDFTMENLHQVIPDYATTILIYCNNNFRDDALAFPSKIFRPREFADITSGKKPISLALNIPTFINLYGYGYRNIYELQSLVSVNDPRLTFEGTSVKPDKRSAKHRNSRR